MRSGAFWLAAALATCAGPEVARGEAFVACRTQRPGDAGLRVLVEAVERNSDNTRFMQRTLGWQPTPLHGSAADVDEIAWCKCVHRQRVEALGEPLAIAMAVQDERAAAYQAWLGRLSPRQQREHTGFLFTSEARCFNASLRKRAR